MQSIGVRTFLNRSGIVDLDLLEGLQAIGEVAFRNCTGLESFVLPVSLISIIDEGM